MHAIPMIDRLLEKFHVAGNGCWEWTGHKCKAGYGALQLKSNSNVRIQAHCASYEAFVGPIPRQMIVAHSCDNPSCINPEHLSVMTLRENTADMFKKRREGKNRVGSQNPISKLDEEKVVAIRRRRKAGESCPSIAKSYSVGVATIYSVCRHASWVHVQP